MSLFEKAKPSEPKPESKRIDLGGLKLPTPTVRPEQEARALAVGEELGFKSREAGETSAPTPQVMRDPIETVAPPVVPDEEGRVPRKKEPSSNLFITGPKKVLNRLTRYTNEKHHSAYWKALDELLKNAGW